MAFDYSPAEAIGFNRLESNDGKKHLASFLILAPPPPGTKIEEAAGRQQTRIAIQNDNKDAQIILADAKGKERIGLLVDRKGNASIQILDRKGRVGFQCPERRVILSRQGATKKSSCIGYSWFVILAPYTSTRL